MLRTTEYNVCKQMDEAPHLLTSSTLEAVLAEVSMKISPCSRAKASPSSFFTSLLDSKSLNTVEKELY